VPRDDTRPINEQLIGRPPKNVLLTCSLFGAKFIARRQEMRKYIVAAVLIGAFVTPAFAQMPGAGPYYVGLDTATHTCSVVAKMATGMKMMGKYKTQAEAEKAMAGMKECKG
jgi:hypothetical protein